MNMTIWQRIQLWINGYAYLRMEKRKGWKAELPIYIVKCEKHYLFEDYPHGHEPYFMCSKCLKE
ncbi:hypothetical protein MUP77_21715 [Candidatus Bathyarchaeota archaeon]|nr:hypothetical protein [Candidatus Bathyarchaeota archaeon]